MGLHLIAIRVSVVWNRAATGAVSSDAALAARMAFGERRVIIRGRARKNGPDRLTYPFCRTIGETVVDPGTAARADDETAIPQGLEVVRNGRLQQTARRR